MRAAAPDRRPPPASWGLAGLALLPLIACWAGYRYGWAGPAQAACGLWGLVLLGLSAGLIAAPAVLRKHWPLAYAAVGVPVLGAALVWFGRADLAEAVSVGLMAILGLDLWAARQGLVPDWWPRLKLGFTVLAVALLLAPMIG